MNTWQWLDKKGEFAASISTAWLNYWYWFILAEKHIELEEQSIFNSQSKWKIKEFEHAWVKKNVKKCHIQVYVYAWLPVGLVGSLKSPLKWSTEEASFEGGLYLQWPHMPN